jgi:hypothetical protein
MDEQETLWGYTECAAAAGCCETTLRVYRAQGRMPKPDEIVGGRPKWVPAHFLAWQAARPGRGCWSRN